MEIQRFFDIVIAIALLVVLSPIILTTYLIVRLYLGAPTIFRQIRSGKHGEPFTIYKFRTMNNRCDQDGALLPDRYRMTKVGNLVRRLSLDELPQIFNILRGEMTFVGPRPLLPEYNVLYDKRQRTRLEVKPGITGLAQVSGRNLLSWESRLELDAVYVEKKSFVFDMIIVAKTMQRLLWPTGVSAQNHVTMHRFTGSDSKRID